MKCSVDRAVRNGWIITLVFMGSALFSNGAQATGAFLYEGQLLDLNGQPIQSPVLIRTKVVSPNSNACTLYEGSIALTPDATGYVRFQVGSPAMSRIDPGLYSIDTIFINKNTFSSLNCAIGTTYTPVSGEGRNLVLSVSDDGGSTWDELGSVEIQAVPVSHVAETLNGLEETSFLRVSGSNSTLPLSATEHAQFLALINGSSTLYAHPGNGAGTVTSITTGTGLTGGPITSTGTISLTNTTVAAGTYGSASTIPSFTVDAQGRITSANDIAITLPQSLTSTSSPTFTSLSLSGSLEMASQSTAKLGSHTSTQESSLVSGFTASDAGRTWYNNTTNELRYWNGTTMQSLSSAGGGISTLNGLAGGAQTFSTSVSGTSPNWSSSGAIHTLNIPLANSVGVTAGLISQTDYNAFNNKLPATLTSGEIYVGSASNMAAAVVPSGDLSLTNTGIFTLSLGGNTTSKILGANPGANRLVTTDSTTGATLSSLGTAINSVLISNGASIPTWAPLANDNFPQYALLNGRTGGQILRGGLSAGEQLTLESTSNVTKGNIILNPSGGNIGIGTTSPIAKLHAEGPVSSIYTKATQSSGGFSSFDASNDVNQHLTMTLWGSTTGSTKYGQSMNGMAVIEANTADSLVLGTTSSTTPLIFGTNNIERMRIDPSTGRVGIGTNTPVAPLDIYTDLAGMSTDVRAYNNNSGGTARYIAGGGGASVGSLSLEAHGLTSSWASGQNAAGDARAQGGSTIWWSGTAANAPLSIASATYLRFYTGVGAANPTAAYEKMRIDASGNVGLGTTAPAARLDVQSNSVSPTVNLHNLNTSAPALKVGAGNGIRNMGLCSISATAGTAGGSWTSDYPCPGVQDNNTVVVCSPPSSGFNGTISARPSMNPGFIQLNPSITVAAATIFTCLWMN